MECGAAPEEALAMEEAEEEAEAESKEALRPAQGSNSAPIQPRLKTPPKGHQGRPQPPDPAPGPRPNRICHA